MSSMYSLPTRDDNPHNFENIPLRDLNQPPESQPRQEQLQPDQTQQNQQAEHEKTKKKYKKYKCTTYGLGVLSAIFLIGITVLGVLYNNSKETPQTSKNGTVSTSIVTTTTSISGKVSTSTLTLPPVTQTLPPVTQTSVTTSTETEVSSITSEITKTSASTITDTTSIIVTPTKDPHDGKRCDNNKQYGGQELHDLNGDYDLLLVDAVQEAVDGGMDIGGAQVLDVAHRSVFLCSGSHSIELVDACESGFEHNGDSVVCNSSGSYPNPSPTNTETETKTSTRSARRRIATGRVS